jgi:hypothetical protein
MLFMQYKIENNFQLHLNAITHNERFRAFIYKCHKKQINKTQFRSIKYNLFISYYGLPHSKHKYVIIAKILKISTYLIFSPSNRNHKIRQLTLQTIRKSYYILQL